MWQSITTFLWQSQGNFIIPHLSGFPWQFVLTQMNFFQEDVESFLLFVTNFNLAKWESLLVLIQNPELKSQTNEVIVQFGELRSVC